MKDEVALHAVSLALPSTVRTNAYWEANAPNLVRDAEHKALSRVFNAQDLQQAGFDQAMQPYLKDPFRGAKRRHVLVGSQTGLDLEIEAARSILAATEVTPDTIISVGFLPQHVGTGNAVRVAAALQHRGNAWNLESACAGPLQALLVARALVTAGQARAVLITISCTYSVQAAGEDTLGWFMGDGGGALLVCAQPDGGILGSYTMHTADTCGSWFHTLEVDEHGKARVRMRASPQTGKLMRNCAEPHLRRCIEGALADAGLGLGDIDCLITHTPTAWFADFAAHALGFDRARTVNTYPDYANLGPALTPANLHRAVSSGLLKPGGTALVFGPGSVSSAAAVVLRWGSNAIATHCTLDAAASPNDNDNDNDNDARHS